MGIVGLIFRDYCFGLLDLYLFINSSIGWAIARVAIYDSVFIRLDVSTIGKNLGSHGTICETT